MTSTSTSRPPIDGGALLALHTYLTVVVGTICLLVWALAGPHDEFWPAWVWQGTALPLALHYGIRNARHDLWRLHLVVSGVLGLGVTSSWALDGAEGAWIAWPLAGLATALVTHAAWRHFGRPLRRLV